MNLSELFYETFVHGLKNQANLMPSLHMKFMLALNITKLCVAL